MGREIQGESWGKIEFIALFSKQHFFSCYRCYISSTYYPLRISNNIQSTPSPCINNMMHSASTLSFFLLQKYQAKQMWEQVTIFKSPPILSPTPLPVYAMRLQKQSAFFFYLRFVFHQRSSLFQVLFMTLGAPQVTGENKRA